MPANFPLARASLKRCRGAALIEFSVVAVPILLAGLGSIEIAQWFYVKQAVSLALLQAGRAGITQHGSPSAIQAAFEQALLPLYVSGSTASAPQRMRQAFSRRSEHVAAPPWQIQILGPAAAAFHDFSDARLPIGQQTGLAAINNDYQAEQDQRYRKKGWPDGLGPTSRLTIFQANTLVLRATYLHDPLLPGMKGLIRMLGNDTGGYASRAMARGGYLPITQELALTMHSHPLEWPSTADGKVVKYAPDTQQATAPRAAAPCHGLWCLDSPSIQPITTQTAHPAASPAPDDIPGTPIADWHAEQPLPDPGAVSVDADCPASLCCPGA